MRLLLLLLLLTLFARARVRCSGIPPEAVRAALRLVADRLVRGQLVRAARERLYGGADARGGQLALHDRKPRAQPARQQRDVGPPRAPLSTASHPISHTIPTPLHSSSASVSLHVHGITSFSHFRLILHASSASVFCVQSYQNFSRKLRDKLRERYPKSYERILKDFPEAALAYDAVWAVAFALQNATREYESTLHYCCLLPLIDFTSSMI